MNIKVLYVYDSLILFNILEELKDNLKFKIIYINKKDYQKTNFDEVANYLIISNNLNDQNKNVVILDKLPIKITDLIYVDQPLFYFDDNHGDGRNW